LAHSLGDLSGPYVIGCGTIGGKGGITLLIGKCVLLDPNRLLDQASFADTQQPAYEDDLELELWKMVKSCHYNYIQDILP
jgi:hypothetical protein